MLRRDAYLQNSIQNALVVKSTWVDGDGDIFMSIFSGDSKESRQIPTIIFIIFWDHLIFYQIFLSSQVTRCVIITYKNGIYEVPHELPNDLRLRILGNYKILGKCLNLIKS